MIDLKLICGEILKKLNKAFETKNWYEFGSHVYEMYAYIVSGIEDLVIKKPEIKIKKEEMN